MMTTILLMEQNVEKDKIIMCQEDIAHKIVIFIYVLQ